MRKSKTELAVEQKTFFLQGFGQMANFVIYLFRMAIHFYQHAVSLRLGQSTRLKQFIAALFKNEGRSVDKLQYIFCTDEFLLSLNQQFLQHDTYTDIITFDLSESPQKISGEIYISTERVKENAQKFKVAFEKELHRVVFHGALHLCGYKDKTARDRVLMRQKEDQYLNAYFST